VPHRKGLPAHHRQRPRALALGYSDSKSAVAFTESYGVFQRAALQHEPSYQVREPSPMASTAHEEYAHAVSEARLGLCLRHALNKLPDKLIGVSAQRARGCAQRSTPCSTGADSAQACGWWHWASVYVALSITSPPPWARSTVSACGTGFRRRKQVGMPCLQTRRCRR